MHINRIYKRYLVLKWSYIVVYREHQQSIKGLNDVPYTVLRLLKLQHHNEDLEWWQCKLVINVKKELVRRAKLTKTVA